MATRTPPRFVPTLTEVVRVPAATPTDAAAAPMLSQEQWVHRIMQRVDITLDRRLREAIATVVLEQTRTLAPMLREQVEAVVRQAVAQALEEELDATKNSPIR